MLPGQGLELHGLDSLSSPGHDVPGGEPAGRYSQVRVLKYKNQHKLQFYALAQAVMN